MSEARLFISDPASWNEFLKKFGDVDVYFTPKYAESYNLVCEGENCAFAYEDAGKAFLFPFRLRPIDGTEYFDTISDYGYGGPISTCSDAAFLEDAYAALDSRLSEMKVVSEFCRYHPLLGNSALASHSRDILFCNNTVASDIRPTRDEILMSIDIKKRSNYRRALKNGTSTRLGTLADVGRFYEIYTQTMRAVSASEFYFLSEDFFADTMKIMGDDAMLLLAEVEGQTVAGTMLLKSKSRLHYYYSGKDVEHPLYAKSNAVTVLLVDAMNLALDLGLKEFHLGGGVGGKEDSLFLFKKDFSDRLCDFNVSKKILLPDVYAELCAARGIDAAESFFPAYRKQ